VDGEALVDESELADFRPPGAFPLVPMCPSGRPAPRGALKRSFFVLVPFALFADKSLGSGHPCVPPLAGPVPKQNVCVRLRSSAVNYGAVRLSIQRLILLQLCG
jgi:hypothetical protein